MLLTARMVSAGLEAGSNGAAFMDNLRRRSPARGSGRRWRAGASCDGSTPPLSRPPRLPEGEPSLLRSLVAGFRPLRPAGVLLGVVLGGGVELTLHHVGH